MWNNLRTYTYIELDNFIDKCKLWEINYAIVVAVSLWEITQLRVLHVLVDISVLLRRMARGIYVYHFSNLLLRLKPVQVHHLQAYSFSLNWVIPRWECK